MFVVHFNQRARFGLPDNKPFTGSIEELESAISKFDLGGTTALYDAILLANSQFVKHATYGRKDPAGHHRWRRQLQQGEPGGNARGVSGFRGCGLPDRTLRPGQPGPEPGRAEANCRCHRRRIFLSGGNSGHHQDLRGDCRRRSPAVYAWDSQAPKMARYHEIEVTASDPKSRRPESPHAAGILCGKAARQRESQRDPRRNHMGKTRRAGETT